jgi:hypothetical protein
VGADQQYGGLMAVDFPASPTNGQVYNGYVYQSGAWNRAATTALPKNYIVNPCMQISQQFGNTAMADSSGQWLFMADQWLIRNNTGDMIMATSQRVQVPTPGGATDRVRSTTTTAMPITPSGEWAFQQIIEGNRIADLQWGTANAKQIIVRVGLKVPVAGTFSLKVGNLPNNRSYVAPFTITSGQVNTDIILTFVIPGDTAGAWKIDASAGLLVSIQMCGGITVTTANTWLAQNGDAMLGQTNGGRPVGNVWEFFDVGLYADPYKTGIAPPFVVPDPIAELRTCQRYWVKVFGLRGIVIGVPSTNNGRAGSEIPVPMRVSPSLALSLNPYSYDGSAQQYHNSVSGGYTAFSYEVAHIDCDLLFAGGDSDDLDAILGGDDNYYWRGREDVMGINFPDAPIANQAYASGRAWTYNSERWNAADPVALLGNRIVNPNMTVSQENGFNNPGYVTSYSWCTADQWISAWQMVANGLTAHSYVADVSETTVWPGNTIVHYNAYTGTGLTHPNDYCHHYQYLEGQRVADFLWGTANARPAVLRFACMSPTVGWYSASIQNYLRPVASIPASTSPFRRWEVRH